MDFWVVENFIVSGIVKADDLVSSGFNAQIYAFLLFFKTGHWH